MRHRFGLLLAASLAAVASTSAQAVTLAADGTWHEFAVDELLSNSFDWVDDNADPLTFTFTLAQGGILKVVDLGFRGDMFSIRDLSGPASLGTTSSVSNPNVFGETLVFDADAAFANPAFSSGSFLLAAGSYEITGTLVQSAFYDDGGLEFTGPLNSTFGAVSLTAVPVPAAAWLFAAGASLLGLGRRRQPT